MTRWIGAGVLALALILGGSAAITPAAAAQSGLQTPQPQATDLSARRRTPHPARYADRPQVQPYYYDRPGYYRPYPYALPLPFFLGFAFQPWW
jgi:hypothetical protein